MLNECKSNYQVKKKQQNKLRIINGIFIYFSKRYKNKIFKFKRNVRERLKIYAKVASEFENDKFLQGVLAKLSWTSITAIMDQVKDREQRNWYIMIIDYINLN